MDCSCHIKNINQLILYINFHCQSGTKNMSSVFISLYYFCCCIQLVVFCWLSVVSEWLFGQVMAARTEGTRRGTPAATCMKSYGFTVPGGGYRRALGPTKPSTTEQVILPPVVPTESSISVY